jgi:hypothetical protein
MIAFRLLLLVLWVVLAVYTGFVIAEHGMTLLPIFFGDIAKMTWPGQFNLDFLWFLTLSAFWTTWRANFSLPSLLLAVVAFFGGAGFLLPYLLFLTSRSKGDMASVLLGRRR